MAKTTRRQTEPPVSQQNEAADLPRPGNEPPPTAETPSHDQIAERAYSRYLSRAGAEGSDVEDWLEAERELKHRR